MYLFAACSTLFFTACDSDNSDDACSYNNQIVVLQNQLTADVDTFLQSVSYPEANTAVLYQSAQKSAQSVTEKLKLIKQFEGGTSFYIETQNYIKACQNTLLDEGAKIVELKANLSLSYNQKDLMLINQYCNVFYAKIKTAAVKFDKAQLDFANKHHFEVITYSKND